MCRRTADLSRSSTERGQPNYSPDGKRIEGGKNCGQAPRKQFNDIAGHVLRSTQRVARGCSLTLRFFVVPNEQPLTYITSLRLYLPADF
jgi:hypothetical protein